MVALSGVLCLGLRQVVTCQGTCHVPSLHLSDVSCGQSYARHVTVFVSPLSLVLVIMVVLFLRGTAGGWHCQHVPLPLATVNDSVLTP